MTTRRLDIRPEALDELDEAVGWYERCRPGLGMELYAEVERVIANIAERPESFPIWRVDLPYRKARSLRFPYIVVFETYEDRIVVSAVSHTSRRPGHWLKRTR